MLPGFLIQLTGFYILYSTSARAVFVKRKPDIWLQHHLILSKTIGWMLVTGSFAVFMIQLGPVIGFFVALTSIMTISGIIIILFPLQKDKTTEPR